MLVWRKCDLDKHTKFEAPKSTLLFCCNLQRAQSSCALSFLERVQEPKKTKDFFFFFFAFSSGSFLRFFFFL